MNAPLSTASTSRSDDSAFALDAATSCARESIRRAIEAALMISWTSGMGAFLGLTTLYGTVG